MKEKVIDIVKDILDIQEVDTAANILDDLGADSIAVMEIVMELEEAFDFEVPQEDIMNLTTVDDIVTYIESKQ